MEPKRLLILGGGISGLTTAYYAEQCAKKWDIPLQVTLVEASKRLGGAIHTEKKDGVLVEHGPDSFATDKPAALQLCRDLGLDHELIGVHPDYRKIFLRHGRRIYPIPQDFYLMAPTRFRAVFEMPFMSLLGKLRMGLELFIPKKTSLQDESLGDFVERRFGRQMLDRIAQPLFGSIFGCDIRQLSIKAAFPRFKNMEIEKGSVIRALTEMKKNPVSPNAAKAKAPAIGMFATLRSGLSTLVEALSHRTEARKILSSKAKRLEYYQSWKLFLENGTVLESDYLCVALPAFQAARLFDAFDPDMADTLDAQPRKSMYVAYAVFSKDASKKLAKASGFVGSADSKQKIQGASFSSFKFEGRSPEGTCAVRIFAGHLWHATFESMSDQEIGAILSEEFCQFFNIQEKPKSVFVSRHPESMPLYRVGHLDWVEEIEVLRRHRYPNLFLNGCSYHGASLPDCVRVAKSSAETMVQQMIEETKFSQEILI